MKTENMREAEDLIELGAFTVATKGEIDGVRPDNPMNPSLKFPNPGLTAD